MRKLASNFDISPVPLTLRMDHADLTGENIAQEP